ncbi:MAG: methyltransferase domain-containing protein [Anaerolineales bacterium]|nr:methyltransferase domain-containing protein [Anaerolineales bacterium]
MNDYHPEISEDRLFFFDKQDVTVDDFHAEGFVLDIGGGGRGVIGRLKGDQVIAIDPSKRELEEAAAGPLKIVMDATDMHFLDNSFGTVTSFFTLMYIEGVDHEKVFREVFRVLGPGGRFLIWDAVFPPRISEEKDVAVFPLNVKLPDGEIDAVYGVLWPEGGRDVSYYARLAEGVGFKIISEMVEGQQLFLELKKPEGS